MFRCKNSNKRTGGNLQLVDVVFLKSAAVDLKSSSLLLLSLERNCHTHREIMKFTRNTIKNRIENL